MEACLHNDSERLTLITRGAAYTFANLKGEEAELIYYSKGSFTTVASENDMWVMQLDCSKLSRDNEIATLELYCITEEDSESQVLVPKKRMSIPIRMSQSFSSRPTGIK